MVKRISFEEKIGIFIRYFGWFAVERAAIT
jgi:hypothetical protein